MTIFASSFTDKEGVKAPFENYDTVSVVGCSKGDNVTYYAMYSSKGAGVYKAFASNKILFSNYKELNVDFLPSVDDSNVKLKLDEQLAHVELLKQKQMDSIYAKLNDSKTILIESYKKKAPIIVEIDSWISNSVGGIEVNLSVTNCSPQAIKYVTFQGYFLNSVGDRCQNEVGGGTVWKAQGIGPIGPRPTTLENFDQRFEECHGKYTFDHLKFYSRVANRFRLSSITIQYMNGKTITLSGKNLDVHVIYN